MFINCTVSLNTGNTREQITVLVAGFASGEVVKPLVLYDGKLIMEKWFDGTSIGIHIDRNVSGFMDSHFFFSYVQKVVLPYMENLDDLMGVSTKLIQTIKLKLT